MTHYVEHDNAIVGFKGFDSSLKCMGYKFKIGGSFFVEGDPQSIALCQKGFHFCRLPIHVLSYYSPKTPYYPRSRQDRYAIVSADGYVIEDAEKSVCSHLTIRQEITYEQLLEYADVTIPYLLDQGHSFIESLKGMDTSLLPTIKRFFPRHCFLPRKIKLSEVEHPLFCVYLGITGVKFTPLDLYQGVDFGNSSFEKTLAYLARRCPNSLVCSSLDFEVLLPLFSGMLAYVPICPSLDLKLVLQCVVFPTRYSMTPDLARGLLHLGCDVNQGNHRVIRKIIKENT